jgi:hypothetical protein
MDTHPYFRRSRPVRQNPLLFEFNRIDLTFAHLASYPDTMPGATPPDLRGPANALLDSRAAAAVSATVGDPASVKVQPRFGMTFDPEALLELKVYASVAPTVFIVAAKSLAAMAYADYFPDAPLADSIRAKVSEAFIEAGPGWCGTFGPDVSAQGTGYYEGNYEFSEMFILPIVYSFYDELTASAREHAISLLLAQGRIHRANLDDTFTSQGPPNDWSRAGYVALGVKVHDIPETENHVLMIAAARYLTNQLLYQRDHDTSHDNRRNGDPTDPRPTSMDQLLGLLRNYLRDDFAEYNAKNYQEETRHALLNLCSYAYDAEVRLAAQMVLDYISAHVAVSSVDSRRMVPFRRRNEPINVRSIDHEWWAMDVSLLDAHGADPMPAQFAFLAGNTRAYESPNFRVWPEDTGPARPWSWAITPNFCSELTIAAIATYRLPPSIHDLFVNDLHRRFFQRLHRHVLEEPGQQRNCDNMEIYSGSPSYLITAGGQPADYVIPGVLGFGDQPQNLGVAVPTNFMPTGRSSGNDGSFRILAQTIRFDSPPTTATEIASNLGRSRAFSLRELFLNTNNTRDLIQLSALTATPYLQRLDQPGVSENYGVAPDFACGYYFHFPAWTGIAHNDDGWFYIDRKSRGGEPAGFYLAIKKFGSLAIFEAFDTWTHPLVTFEQFTQHVKDDNANLQLVSNQPAVYTTYFGNKIQFLIWGDDWNNPARDNFRMGGVILNIDYGPAAPSDTLSDAGNYTDDTQFLNGTVLNSRGDAVTEIRNSFLNTTIRLDWSDPSHLIRTAEDGTVEHAGKNAAGQPFEVWVDFNWNGEQVGDFYRPFNSLETAINAVADEGAIRIAPGTSAARPAGLRRGKRFKMRAPIGGVSLGGP